MAILLALLACPTALADVTVTFIDVGQGDSIWVHDDTGFDALIDGGPRGRDATVAALLQDVPDLDVVVLTHGHEDHVGGLYNLVEGKPVRQVLTAYPYSSVIFTHLMDLVASLRILKSEPRTGDAYVWGQSTATVLRPGQRTSNENNNSVVLRLVHGDVAFLLTGDAETQAEGAMLGGTLPLKAQILKVAHHGSRTSSGAAFLAAVRPETAVISVGAGNSYGHPTSETLGRLAQAGARVYRTDLDGTTAVRSSGSGYAVTTARGARWAVYLPVAGKAW